MQHSVCGTNFPEQMRLPCLKLLSQFSVLCVLVFFTLLQLHCLLSVKSIWLGYRKVVKLIFCSVKSLTGQSGHFGQQLHIPGNSFPTSAYIRFHPAFEHTPAIVYGLYLYDTSRLANSRFNTIVRNLSRYGFNITISSWADTKMFGARISWMACLKNVWDTSRQSHFDLYYHTINVYLISVTTF